jgi:hypothetical protein
MSLGEFALMQARLKAGGTASPWEDMFHAIALL